MTSVRWVRLIAMGAIGSLGFASLGFGVSGCSAPADASVLLDLKAQGKTIVLSSHHLSEVETLADRLALPSVDPAGFLVADDPERPGELGGFCWTIVHPRTASDPAIGEIYVIGVDPSRQGERWGPALVLAGLDHLAAAGITQAMLYVDQANGAARGLYKKLGFKSNHRRRVYQR